MIKAINCKPLLKLSSLGCSCLLSGWLLVGCHSTTGTPSAPSSHTSSSTRLTTDQLSSANIQITQQGSRLTLLIPTDAFFDPGTANIRPDKALVLQQMAQFVQNYAAQYPLAIIRVNGYTDTVFSRQTSQTLSQQYAQAISSYLWNQGIAPSRIRVQGYGSTPNIANPTNVHGTALNRRVEIHIN